MGKIKNLNSETSLLHINQATTKMNTAHHFQPQAPIYYYEAPMGSNKHGYVDVYEHSYVQQQTQQPVSKKQRLVTYEYTPLQSHGSQRYYDFSNSNVNNGAYTQQQVQFNIGTSSSSSMHYNNNYGNHGVYVSTPTKSVPMTQQQPAYINMNNNNNNLQYNQHQQFQQIVSPVPVEPFVTPTPELEF